MNIDELLNDVERRFTHYAPANAAVSEAHTDVRTILGNAAQDLVSLAAVVAPPGREISLALTALEEADHWLHAHIARNQGGVEGEAADVAEDVAGAGEKVLDDVEGAQAAQDPTPAATPPPASPVPPVAASAAPTADPTPPTAGTVPPAPPAGFAEGTAPAGS